jgi:hypothetical protein
VHLVESQCWTPTTAAEHLKPKGSRPNAPFRVHVVDFVERREGQAQCDRPCVIVPHRLARLRAALQCLALGLRRCDARMPEGRNPMSACPIRSLATFGPTQAHFADS